MEAVKIGEEGSASMATNNRRLSIEDYLDLIKNRDHKLNSCQLQKVISMHGFRGTAVQKSILLEAVKTINLMDLRRSTLKDSTVSADACLSLAGVINDLSGLQWQECHVTSLITQRASATAISATNDGTVPVNRKKSKGLAKSSVKVEADDPVVSTTNTIEAAPNTTVVKFKRLEDLIKKPVEDAAHDSIIPTPGTTVDAGSTTVIPTPGTTVDAGSTTVKGKKSKGLEKKPVKVSAAHDSIIPTPGTTVDAGSTTVIPTPGTTVDAGSTTVKGKKSKGLEKKPVKVSAADNSTVPFSSAAVSMKRKTLEGLGDEPVQDAADASTISTESTTVAAGGTVVSVKKKKVKGIGMKSVGCSCC